MLSMVLRQQLCWQTAQRFIVLPVQIFLLYSFRLAMTLLHQMRMVHRLLIGVTRFISAREPLGQQDTNGKQQTLTQLL